MTPALMTMTIIPPMLFHALALSQVKLLRKHSANQKAPVAVRQMRILEACCSVCGSWSSHASTTCQLFTIEASQTELICIFFSQGPQLLSSTWNAQNKLGGQYYFHTPRTVSERRWGLHSTSHTAPYTLLNLEFMKEDSVLAKRKLSVLKKSWTGPLRCHSLAVWSQTNCIDQLICSF